MKPADAGAAGRAFEKHPVKRLFVTYLRPRLGLIMLAVLFMIVGAVTTAAFAKLIEPILDHILNDGRERLIVPLALSVFGCFLVSGLATYFHTIIMNKVGQTMVAEIQHQLFSRFLDLDLAFFHQNASGQLASRIVNDVTIIRDAVTNTFTGFGKNFLTLIFLVGVMFYQDWRLSLIAFVVLPFGAVFVFFIGKRLRRLSGNIQQEIAGLSGLLIQLFQGARQIKAYGMEDFERDRVGERVHSLKRHIIRSVRLDNLSTPFNEALIGLALTGLITYGGYQVAGGEMTTGKLMSFIAAFSLAYEPMKKLAKLNNILQMGLGAADRVFDMMDRAPAIVNRPGAQPMGPGAPEIRFESVSFRYNDDDEYALRDASFTAEAGKVTALVGPSGSGKTTSLNLVPRFYDVGAGRVLIGGRDVRDLTLESLRAHIALVSQDITVFDDTVWNNIAYGLKGATEGEVLAAAAAAAADEFVRQLPEGYETRLGENGVKLSGGQRQRIAIARAILRNAPILLLDEATSALDTESERLIQDSLSRLQTGRTVLIIAHRLSTVQEADRIVVMDGGRVREQGTHAELLVADGLYARMYQSGLKE